MHQSRDNVQWQNSGNKPQHRVEERVENEEVGAPAPT